MGDYHTEKVSHNCIRECSEPLVSVIIPTFNRAHLLRRAIESVLQQSLGCWELIVIDDGSTDETPEIVAGFRDPRIRYIHHGHNRGNAAARNTGIRLSSGKYVAFLDDDDEWLPDKLERQVALLESCPREVGLVYCGVTFLDVVTGKRRYKRPRLKGYVGAQVLTWNGIGTASSVVIRREVLDEMGGFDEALPACVDWDMWIRVSQKYMVDFVDDPLVIYREHSASVTANEDKIVRGWQRLWEKHSIGQCSRTIRSLHYFRLGHTLCYRGSTATGRQFMWRGIVLAPWKVQWIALYAVATAFPRRYRDITFVLQGVRECIAAHVGRRL